MSRRLLHLESGVRIASDRIQQKTTYSSAIDNLWAGFSACLAREPAAQAVESSETQTANRDRTGPV